MAGELTHIIPTHPSDPAYKASQTRQIVYVDPNGTQHNIIAVYWSPTNNVNDRKLIWQLSNDVPYDDTCIATITLNQNKTAWIVTITKDSEDVTSSLSQMTTWIYNGKGERVNPERVYTNTIDLSQHPRGDYHVDLAQITSKAGGYFPSRGSISVQDHIYIGNLVAGDRCVAIEYVPTTDTTVNSIEIYTTSNQGDNNLARVKIIHESGLYIAAFNNDNGPDVANIYHLSGYKRYVNNQNVLLKAGKKYYIVYQHDDANPGENTFWPAYFQNENGNYKEYSNNRDTVTTTDISSLGTYIGETSDLADVFNLLENDFFIWSGSTSTMDNALFIRSNKGNGTSYKGELGVDTGYIRSQDVQAFIAMSINDSFRLMPQNTGISSGTFMYKSSLTPNSTTDYGSQSTAALRLALLLMNIKNNTTTFCISGTSAWEYGWNPSDMLGYAFKMESGYSSQVSSLTPLNTLPENPVNGGLYFLQNGLVSGMQGDRICLYNGSWTVIFNHTDISNYFNRTYITTYMTVIGTISDLTKQKISGEGNISDSLRSATLGTTRKYYLKINGNEV